MTVAIRRALARRVYYGWVIVVACLLASMVVFGTSYAFSVFFDALLAEFDRSQAAISAAFGLQTALLFVGAVVVGRLVERHGRRRIAAAGGLVIAVGLGWTALARSYLELLAAFGVVTACGMAALYVVGYATVPRWFQRRRGTAGGIAAAGLGVGLLTIPPGASLLIDALGWRLAVLALAALVAATSAVVVAVLADRPEEVGADPGDEFRESDPPDASDTAANALSVVRSPPFLLVFVGWVLVYAPLYVVLGYVVLYASDVGLGRRVGVLAITVLGIATTASRVGIGMLSDRVGRTRTFVACSALMGLSTAVLAGVGSAAGVLLVVLSFGVGYGGSGGLIGPFVADVFGNRNLDTLFSVMSLSFAVAGLAAPPATGLLYEHLGTYAPAFVLSGVGGVAGAGLVLLGARRA